jgi:hypothetical protein
MSIEQLPSQNNESSDQAEFQDILTYSNATANVYEAKLAELREIESDPDTDDIDKYMAGVGIATAHLELRCITAKEAMRILSLLQKSESQNAPNIEKVSATLAESLNWIRENGDAIESSYGVDVKQILDKYGIGNLAE